MRKYIIFKAQSMSAEGWENRMLAHTGATTDILCEYYDSSDEPLPQPGNRPYEFYRIEEFDDPQFPDSDTHYRVGDWEVLTLPGLKARGFLIQPVDLPVDAATKE